MQWASVHALQNSERVWQGDLAILAQHLGQRQASELTITLVRAEVREGALHLFLRLTLDPGAAGDEAGGGPQRLFSLGVQVIDDTVFGAQIRGRRQRHDNHQGGACGSSGPVALAKPRGALLAASELTGDPRSHRKP